ncbi:YggS family pyridoxal phosphate enzyme [Jatrophihabitans fulvus]
MNEPGRDAQIVAALGALRARIADACTAAGRDPQQVTLVAVSKTRPADDVAVLARLGVLDVGESKDQEAVAKREALAALLPDPAALRWHLVGRLQTNKARSVVGYAHAVHSLDRAKLARALDDAVGDRRDPALGPLEVFVQVSLDGDPERGGVTEAELPALLDDVAGRARLRLRGLMAVPPIGSDPDEQFARLQDLFGRSRADHPGLDALSAGMSGDLEAAIRHGATHVRVGSALLGRREPVVG